MENRKYSLVFRLMHWSIALCILLLIGTIFLRMNWMNRNNMAVIISERLTALNIPITMEQAQKVAREIRKPMWEWHIYVGYVLLGLYSIRLLLPIAGQMRFRNPFSKGHSSLKKFEYSMYILFYICLGISLVTGLSIEIGPKDIEELMEDIHVLSLYYLIPFIFIHFAGVLIAELGTQRGIVSGMINGETADKHN